MHSWFDINNVGVVQAVNYVVIVLSRLAGHVDICNSENMSSHGSRVVILALLTLSVQSDMDYTIKTTGISTVATSGLY